MKIAAPKLVAIVVGIAAFVCSGVSVQNVFAVGKIERAPVPAGTRDDPRIDSALSLAQALEGIDQSCPARIRERLRIIDVVYHSFDGQVHRGQIVVDKDVVDDIEELFHFAYDEGFPFESVIPLSDPRFTRNGSWSDDLSMQLNNTSSFHYRRKTGGTALSAHAFGCAIDVNPRLNPFIASQSVLPRGSSYEPTLPGTLTLDSKLVILMKRLGWIWGGDWKDPKDYQHFENPSKCARILQESMEERS
jgi:peptidoglycan LD-endopeptidase CwlK